MAEISREDAIKNLSMIRASLDYIEIDEELDKAISDMEKLQKIEEVIANSTFHPNNYMASVELLKIIKEIEQIVKEQP